jgi:hypothetical protein
MRAGRFDASWGTPMSINSELLTATGGRLHVPDGWAVMQMIEALDRGVYACIPTALHAVYVPIYRIYA